MVRAPFAYLQELEGSQALWPGWEGMEPASAGCEGQGLPSERIFLWLWISEREQNATSGAALGAVSSFCPLLHRLMCGAEDQDGGTWHQDSRDGQSPPARSAQAV